RAGAHPRHVVAGHALRAAVAVRLTGQRPSSRASRTDSAYDIGSPGTTSRIVWSVTTTSVPIESIRWRPVVTSTFVTRASQYDDSRGVRTGTRTIGTRDPFDSWAADRPGARPDASAVV